jgi:hypothetical protein
VVALAPPEGIKIVDAQGEVLPEVRRVLKIAAEQKLYQSSH